MFKRELYLKRIRNLIDKEDVKVISGVRRSGKTCLLKLIVDELKERNVSEENIIYMSFESSFYDDIINWMKKNVETEFISETLFDCFYIANSVEEVEKIVEDNLSKEK